MGWLGMYRFKRKETQKERVTRAQNKLHSFYRFSSILRDLGLITSREMYELDEYQVLKQDIAFLKDRLAHWTGKE